MEHKKPGAGWARGRPVSGLPQHATALTGRRATAGSRPWPGQARAGQNRAGQPQAGRQPGRQPGEGHHHNRLPAPTVILRHRLLRQRQRQRQRQRPAVPIFYCRSGRCPLPPLTSPHLRLHLRRAARPVPSCPGPFLFRCSSSFLLSLLYFFFVLSLPEASSTPHRTAPPFCLPIRTTVTTHTHPCGVPPH